MVSDFFSSGLQRLGRSITVCSLLMLSACSFTPDLPPPVELRLRISVSDSTNPNPDGRPSPVLIRVYFLKNATAFGRADFFTLFDEDKTLLGADLLQVKEDILRPGETKTLHQDLDKDAAFLGVLAAYHDISQANWREMIKIVPPADEDQYVRLTLSVDELSLKLREISPADKDE